MVSLADRELLLSIKRQISQPFDSHIDKISNFVKELKPYMFESDAILNIELLDYFAADKQNDWFELFMKRLERDGILFWRSTIIMVINKQQCSTIILNGVQTVRGITLLNQKMRMRNYL